MSPLQIAKQVRHLLRIATWAESPNALILGTSAYVSPGLRDDDDVPVRLPFALVNLGQQTPDSDDPHLLTQEIVVVLAASVHGDPLGEHSLTGGPGASSGRFGKSDGRGLLELETGLLTSVGRMTGADGAPIVVSHVSAPAPERLEGDVHLVHRQYVLSVVCTRQDEYPAPTKLLLTSNTLSWTLPPPMYGLRRIHLRYATGATAPTAYTAGTPVTLASDLATSVTFAGASGKAFALFAAYTESGAPADEFFSAQSVGSYRAVP